ncbi:acetamidase/formamidase family protein [Caldilinea sp.]|uniref:acetamidase/formamidase family protein n=1 Tax=Caldilinea sp. TaxID=2293560 RepID=UPI002B6368C8|nr:acetamidase/formamidase family protein [Anaerolineales bacterium]HQY94698.1 acetamidase/formamidase family protein [Caldilinea sp.]HRA68595.1 acetamidase/formamidase family protein [Caldilinea sp.]
MTIHTFTPSHYFNVLATVPPVLRLAPGDAVHTTTVDAHGIDAERRQVTPPGNPMTGPFFVEGAEPGDTLVVHLDAITPNRTYGWSGVMLAPNVVDPSFVAELPWPPAGTRRRGEWHVDVAAGTATLRDPVVPGGMVLPLAPMLGCFGVAPADGEAISTATSGPQGGNMDYRGFVAGVTVYFPVFAPGALFFLGDGHAVQGAGEIAGTGVEISCDVRFTVDLQKGRRIAWPRGETASHILTAGNARPLDQALQHATTELARWLQEEYGLSPIHAQTLLGQAVDYEVGNVFDPAYTMICKLEKRWLAA